MVWLERYQKPNAIYTASKESNKSSTTNIKEFLRVWISERKKPNVALVEITNVYHANQHHHSWIYQWIVV
jgi:hypothetical protein